MDNNHNIIITPLGQYEYDSDFDVYRRVPSSQETTALAQYGWIYLCLFLTALCFILEHALAK